MRLAWEILMYIQYIRSLLFMRSPVHCQCVHINIYLYICLTARFSLASKWSDTRTESLLYWSADKYAYLSISVVKVFISTLCQSVVWTVYWMLLYTNNINETICCCLLFSENKSCGWRMMRAYRSCWWATSAIWMISARCRWASASWGAAMGGALCGDLG